MSRPLLRLLHWQLQFDSRRVAVWLIGGCYVLLAIWWTMGAIQSTLWGAPPTVVIWSLINLHSVMAVIYPLFRASRMVEDWTSGVMGLIKLTDTPARVWATFRLLSVVAGWLPIWILRWPLYALIWTLGGWTMDVVWTAELLQWTALFTTASVTLAVGRYCQTPRAARLVSGLILATSQVLLLFLGRLSLIVQLWELPSSSLDWAMALASITLHLLGAALCLEALASIAYFRAEEGDAVEAAPADDRPAAEWSSDVRRPIESAANPLDSRLLDPRPLDPKLGEPKSGEPRGNRRPPRRVWKDALAWQCFQVHSGGAATVHIKFALYGTLLALLLGMWALDSLLFQILLIMGPVAGAVIAAFKPGDCAARELKAGTLPTLMLLPVNGRDLYDGWSRGNWRLAAPDFAWMVIVLSILFAQPESIMPLGGKIGIACVSVAILLLGPLLFLNQLYRLQLEFLPVGCFFILIGVGVCVLCMVLLVEEQFVAAVAVFLGSTLAARQGFLSLIPQLVQERVEEQP
ncbi:MAG: hypothetical protein KF774_15300 [Planctomyces sp.]|nr:hypothetical protein [Planctomyces sp.]